MSTVYVWNKYNLDVTSSSTSIQMDDHLNDYDERITDFNGVYIQGIGTWDIGTWLWGELNSSDSITIKIGSSVSIVNNNTTNAEYSIEGGITKTYSFNGYTGNSSHEYSDTFNTYDGKLYIGLLDASGLCRTYIQRNFSLQDEDGNYKKGNLGTITTRIRFGRYALNFSPKYPYIEIMPFCDKDSTYNDSDFAVTYAQVCSVNNLTNTTKKGSTSYGAVESEDRNAYPDNSYSGDYWYEYSHSYESGPNLYANNSSIKKVKIYTSNDNSVKLCDIYTCKNGNIIKI